MLADAAEFKRHVDDVEAEQVRKAQDIEQQRRKLEADLARESSRTSLAAVHGYSICEPLQTCTLPICSTLLLVIT